MTLSMYAASVPVFTRQLKSLDAILDKAVSYAEASKFDPAILLTARLYPDMFTMTRQVQIATDAAKGAAARLAGLPVPSFPDTEATFPELKARIAKTLDFIGSVRPDQIDGSEGREIKLKVGPPDRAEELVFNGQDYPSHLRAAELLFPCDDGLRDPAPQRPGHRQAGFLGGVKPNERPGAGAPFP